MSGIGNGGLGGSSGGGQPASPLLDQLAGFTGNAFVTLQGDTYTKIDPTNANHELAPDAPTPTQLYENIQIPVRDPYVPRWGWAQIQKLLKQWTVVLKKLKVEGQEGSDDTIFSVHSKNGGNYSDWGIHGNQLFTIDDSFNVLAVYYVAPGHVVTIEGDIISRRTGGTANTATHTSCKFTGHIYNNAGTLSFDNGVFFNKNPTASTLTYGIGQLATDYAYFGVGGLADHDFQHDFHLRAFKGT